MKEVKTTNQFLRDLKLARKRGKDLRKIENVVDTLAGGHKLSPKHRPHRLQGERELGDGLGGSGPAPAFEIG